MSEYVELNDGRRMPSVGLGTFQGSYDYMSVKSTAMASVKSAVEVGYRHFDTAYLYDTEQPLGEAISQLISSKLLNRDDFFITTKLWSNSHRREDVVPALRKSLAALGLDYVDMYLVHWPVAVKRGAEQFPKDEAGDIIFEDDQTSIIETWQGMMECQKLDLTKSIGVSNFCRRQLQTLIDRCAVKPANLQIESHPFFSNSKLIAFCQRNGIQVTAFSPLSKPARSWAKPDDPVVSTHPGLNAIGAKYDKTASQVALRWQVERGVAVVPKSNSVSHQRDNISIFDFSLSDDDIDAISTQCECHLRVLPFRELFGKSKEYPFNDEY